MSFTRPIFRVTRRTTDHGSRTADMVEPFRGQSRRRQASALAGIAGKSLKFDRFRRWHHPWSHTGHAAREAPSHGARKGDSDDGHDLLDTMDSRGWWSVRTVDAGIRHRLQYRTADDAAVGSAGHSGRGELRAASADAGSSGRRERRDGLAGRVRGRGECARVVSARSRRRMRRHQWRISAPHRVRSRSRSTAILVMRRWSP